MKFISKINWSASGWIGLVFALVVSSIFVFITFGRDFILGTSPFWQSQTDDITQYIAGFNMYFTAPWQFPLLAFDGVNYPTGTRVTFVDAIPLYSLLIKALLPTSFAPFNPFGVWVALSFVLQGVSAWWISREIKADNWFFLIALLTFFLTYPALMARLGHISLMSHWILLFAFALYTRSYQQKKLPKWAWTLLIIGSFYINIYLFVMACGLMLASLLGMRRNIDFKDILNFFLPFAVLSLTTFLMLFPLPLAEVTKEWGFGYYSMNLLAPFTGGKIFALQVNDVPGQYEGFNYLGFGWLLALLLGYRLKKTLYFDILRHHRALCVLLIIYTFYALSDHIYFGGQKILILDYPNVLDGLTSQFRASGRFFWGVGYCLIILAFLILYRGLEKRVFASIVVVLVIVQMVDLRDHYRGLKARIQHIVPQPMDYRSWDSILNDQVRTLYFYPKFKCGDGAMHSLLPVMRYAGERGLKLNTGYIARYTPNCQDVSREIASADPGHSAYIFIRSNYPSQEAILSMFPNNRRIRCQQIQFAYVCQPFLENIH